MMGQDATEEVIIGEGQLKAQIASDFINILTKVTYPPYVLFIITIN